MNGIEQISFEIIASVGTARSCFIEAIQCAKNNNFEQASQRMEEGEENFIHGHHAHARLIQQEANQELNNITLLLVHAEDQLMSAEGFKIIAQEFIDLYQKLSINLQ
ncbi:PTS lactose/cellobiose transporter subunit IIA [Breznakia pachnodae]|uniref:PTS system cellobiose-specific IIA component n=1 Tax=Breznakia pachnodae TaxID=265178 RepID=A0ABU0E802_9FIRM|nr:PTS lactose/cellobiose transporter subunit IIA [Breznakia pachnodae]MDQ0363033.1 PTS system cellobiose-specific IIA component [Breznakia pachnodae]